MSGQHYCLRWNDYQTNMTSVFHQLLQTEAFVDVTLACNDLSLKAHKVVLSACSSYFQKLLLENPCNHPTIIMPQVCYADLKFIIDFVYKGEIDVSQTELQSLLKTADQLKIKGLCDDTAEELLQDVVVDVDDDDNRSSTTSIPFAAWEYRKLRRRQRKSGERAKPKTRRKSKESSLSSEKSDPQRATSDGNEGTPALLLNNREDERSSENQSQNMSSNALLAGQMLFSQFGVDTDDFPPDPPAPAATPVGNVEMQDHSPTRILLTNSSVHRTDLSNSNIKFTEIKKERDSKFETLSDMDSHMSGHSMDSYDGHDRKQRSSHTTMMMIKPELMCRIKKERDSRFETLRPSSYQDQDPSLSDMDSHMSGHSMDSYDGHDQQQQRSSHTTMMVIKPELMCMMPGVSSSMDHFKGGGGDSNGHSDSASRQVTGPKTWTQDDMERALDALRNHNMSLTKASATYGIPSTTLWQRAHRLGIDTPKKEGPTKSWTEENLNSALDALRTGTISANKASKAYGIPSSTLYKIARREGIRLAAPFNAAPTTWTPEDLEKALESIRSGQTSVQRASTEFGIPTGTLYGRCKREGIELSRSNPTPWSEGAMGEALEAVRLGHMSINQAAIHYNLPYSSLYGRFKRGVKYESTEPTDHLDAQSRHDGLIPIMDYSNASLQYQTHS